MLYRLSLSLYIISSISIPLKLEAQSITVTNPSGYIKTCVGFASVNPNVQKFSFSGSGLSSGVTVQASVGFEISRLINSGFSGSVLVPASGGSILNTEIFIRASASASLGSITGQVSLTTSGASGKLINVSGVVYSIPEVMTISNKVYVAGEITNEIPFQSSSGTLTYSWTNGLTGIGLPASGIGNIPSFKATNIGTTPLISNITITPRSTSLAYIPGFGNSIRVVNTTTSQPIATIPVGAKPVAVSVSPDGTRVYVLNADSNSVSVISTATNQVIATVAVGSYPDGVVISPDGKNVYVLNSSSKSISVINTINNTVSITIPLTESIPEAIAINAGGTSIYVAGGSNKISIVNTSSNTQSSTVTVGTALTYLTGISVNPVTGNIYAVDGGALQNKVYVIDASSLLVTGSISVSSNPSGMVVAPDGITGYVSTSDSHVVSIINLTTQSVVGTIPVQQFPRDISISPDGNWICVLSSFAQSMTLINTQTKSMVASIAAPGIASGNFFSIASGCTGTAKSFQIKVFPKAVINSSAYSSSFLACEGTGDEPSNLREFKISGVNVFAGITVQAPANFEVSADKNNYTNELLIPVPISGEISETPIYVRIMNAASPGIYMDSIRLSAPGISRAIKVRAHIFPKLRVDPVNSFTYTDATYSRLLTERINFSGVGNNFVWQNDNPLIGLPSDGMGSILPFSPIGNDSTEVKANLTVTPIRGKYAYLVNEGSSTSGRYVTVIDYVTNDTVFQKPAEFGGEVQLSPDGNYLAGFSDLSVKLFSTQRNEWVRTISLSGPGVTLTFSPDSKKLYVAQRISDKVAIINLETFQVTELSVGSTISSMVTSPDGQQLYMVGPSPVKVLNTSTLSIKALYYSNGSIEDVAINSEGKILYLSDNYGSKVIALDALSGTVIKEIIVQWPTTLALTPDDAMLYATSRALNQLYVIDARIGRLINTIPVGTSPVGLSISPDGQDVFVLNRVSNSISVVSTQSNAVTRSINTPAIPFARHNFIIGGQSCGSPNKQFTITVTPRPPTINTTRADGIIESCFGSPSKGNNLQQFYLWAVQLKSPITATAPDNFEISLSADTDFKSTLQFLPSKKGVLDSVTIYVRTSATAAASKILDSIKFESAGATTTFVRTNASVTPKPIVAPLPDLAFVHGDTTSVIKLQGHGGVLNYVWSSSNPLSGLPTSGLGDIGSFIVQNEGTLPITTSVQVNARMVVYAYSISGKTINVINTETKTLERTILVGNWPVSLAITPDGSKLYVADNSDGKVYVIDTSLNEVVETIAVGQYLRQVLLNQDGTVMYVLVEYTISAVDLTTKTIVANTESQNDHLQLSQDGKSIIGLRFYNTTEIIIHVHNSGNLKLKALTRLPASGQHLFSKFNTLIHDSKIYFFLPFDPDYVVWYHRLMVYDLPGLLSDNESGVFKYINPIPYKEISLGSSRLISTKLSKDEKHLYLATGNQVMKMDFKTFEIGQSYTFGNEYFAIFNFNENLMYRQNSNKFSVFNMDSQTVLASITAPSGPYDFVTSPSAGCVSNPSKFDITVYPVGFEQPHISVSSTADQVGACEGTIEKATTKKIEIAGENLLGSINSSVSMDFEISASMAGPFGPSVSIEPAEGKITSTLFVRLNPLANVGVHSGQLEISSSGTNSQSLLIEGLVSALPLLQSAVLPDGEYGSSYSSVVSSGSAGLTFTATNLVSGLNISASGNISGVPEVVVESSEVQITASNTYCSQTEKYFITINKKKASISITNTLHTYDGNGKQVSVQTIPAGLPVDITYNKSFQLPVGAGSYNAEATINSQHYEGSLSAQVDIAPAPWTAIFSNIDYQYNGIGRSVTVTTNPPDVPLTIFYNGNSDMPVNAGEYPVLVVPSGGNYLGNKSAKLTISKADLNVKANSVSFPYKGMFPVLSFSYLGFVNGENGSVIDAEPTISTVAVQNSNAGEYPIILSGGLDNNYYMNLQYGILTITKRTPTLIFHKISDKTTQDGPFAILATTEPTHPVQYSIVSGPATIQRDVISLTGEGGKVNVRAEVVANENFFGAFEDVSFNVILVLAAEQSAGDVSVYPSPASTFFKILLPVTLKGAKVYLTSTQGIQVQDLTDLIYNEIDVTRFSRGLYIIQIAKDGKTIFKKIAIL